MCLGIVDEKTKRTPGEGYKVVEKRDGKYLCWDYMPNAGKVEYPLNRWIEDTNNEVIDGWGGVSYPAGFHVSIELPDYHSSVAHVADGRQIDHNGKELVTIKVKFKSVVASGTERWQHVVIARKIINKGEVSWR